MNDLESANTTFNFKIEETGLTERVIEKEIFSLVDRLDLTDVVILKKFYVTGKEFPFDTQPYCFPILYKEMKEGNNLKIGSEALRKRLDVLVKAGLLNKIDNSNPTNYFPINGKEVLIRMLITKFFILNGITKFF